MRKQWWYTRDIQTDGDWNLIGETVFSRWIRMMNFLKAKQHLWMVPGGLFLLLVASFGLMTPQLGFYWDDWPVLLTARLKGLEGYWEFYRFDRPVSAWTYVAMMPVLGTHPLVWHWTTLLLRWFTTLAFWWSLSGIWPARRREGALAAFLFAVYPVFIQQPISVAYSQHWICYWFYCLSLGTMIWAWRRPRWAVPLTVLGVSVSLLGLMTMEYFAGLELLRPLVLWVMAGEQPGKFWQRVRAVVLRWLPYLLGTAGFMVWRLFLVRLSGTDANAPALLYQFPSAPLDTILRLLQIALQDMAYLWITVWANLFSVETIQLSDRFVLFSWAVSVLVAAAAFFWLKRMPGSAAHTDREVGRTRWVYQMLALGLAAVLLGVLPVWVTGRQMTGGFYANRFGMPAMLGASLLLVGWIAWLTPSWIKQVLLVSVLIGLSTGLHLRTANEYRWSWVKQTRFYWQLSWRAPSILPHTAVFSDGEIFSYVGIYSTASAINLLYPPADLPENELPYYFFSLGRNFAQDMPAFRQGMPVQVDDFRMYRFQGDSRDAILIHYDPVVNNCLHVLSPADVTAPGLPAVTVEALPNASLSRIGSTPSRSYPPELIFGPEPEHGWCYLYQKADLARQFGDWERVVALGEEAVQQGYSIQNPNSSTSFEWLPFIEGYARLGYWDQARQITRDAAARNPLIRDRLCTLWNSLHSLSKQEADVMAAELMCKP
jgi:hypothetical protein